MIIMLTAQSINVPRGKRKQEPNMDQGSAANYKNLINSNMYLTISQEPSSVPCSVISPQRISPVSPNASIVLKMCI